MQTHRRSVEAAAMDALCDPLSVSVSKLYQIGATHEYDSSIWVEILSENFMHRNMSNLFVLNTLCMFTLRFIYRV